MIASSELRPLIAKVGDVVANAVQTLLAEYDDSVSSEKFVEQFTTDLGNALRGFSDAVRSDLGVTISTDFSD